MVEKIILAKPRGFCAGVERAISTVEKALEIHGRPVYVRHEIVHNQHVVENLKEKGAVFIEHIDEVPENSVIIFSAHGTEPAVIEQAEKRKRRIIDAACPLVSKVHYEAKKYHEQGYSIITIGEKSHQEIIGLMGEAPMQVIITAEDAEKITVSSPKKTVYLTQTTLSVDDAEKIAGILKRRFPGIASTGKDNICYATQNRQSAIKKLVAECRKIIVVGGKKSANSKKLAEVAAKSGAESMLLSDASELDFSFLENTKTLGITSGASTPEQVVQEIVGMIKSRFNCAVEEKEYVHESMKFALPKELNKYENP
jgi:4-hydroxy-3-methylbut-2-enyl diphosphate reductase